MFFNWYQPATRIVEWRTLLSVEWASADCERTWRFAEALKPNCDTKLIFPVQEMCAKRALKYVLKVCTVHHSPGKAQLIRVDLLNHSKRDREKLSALEQMGSFRWKYTGWYFFLVDLIPCKIVSYHSVSNHPNVLIQPTRVILNHLGIDNYGHPSYYCLRLRRL